jgi:gas vesicle protein
MTIVKNLMAACAAGLMLAALAGCQQKDELSGAGPAEQAGRKVDQAREKTGRELTQAAEKANQDIIKAADDAKAKINQVTDDASAEASKAVERAGAKVAQAGEKIQDSARKARPADEPAK